MEFISDFAQGFMALFQAGGETFVGWVTGIIPMVICLMTAINSIIKLIGEKRVENFTKKLTRFTIARYTLVPVLAVRFLHPVTGLFPHANPGELFVYMGIAAGITKLNLPLGDLAVRYFIVGVIVILIRGVLTEKIYFRLTSKFTKEKENAEE